MKKIEKDETYLLALIGFSIICITYIILVLHQMFIKELPQMDSSFKNNTDNTQQFIEIEDQLLITLEE